MATFYDADGCGYDHRGDTLVQPDPPDYPHNWTTEQRLAAYWHALAHAITVDTTTGWHGVLASADRHGERRHNKIAELTDPEELF